MQRRDRQRRKLQLFPSIVGQRRLERVRPPGPRPHRAEDADARVDDAPDRELERRRGRVVEPLRVVDRDDDRLIVRELPEEGRGCRRNGAGIDPAARRVVPEDRSRERLSLRRRQHVESCIVDRREEVDKPCERQRGLHTRRSRHEHAPAGGAGELDPRLPDGGLPDSRRASDGERGSSVGRPTEKRLDRPELTPSADDP